MAPLLAAAAAAAAAVLAAAKPQQLHRASLNPGANQTLAQELLLSVL
jgi:hypothetical protein